MGIGEMNSIIRKLKRIIISPERFIPMSFFVTILLGTLLLMLPFATSDGESTGFLTALFTSTTSVCVTGLVVVDTYAHWSVFGQIVILLLIQIGGLGVVAVGSIFLLVGKKKFSLGNRKLLGGALNVDSTRGLLSFLVRIFKGTFLVEGVGAFLYAIEFVPRYGFVKGLWAAVFQSVSAFCNAGMDVTGPNSMIEFRDSGFLMGLTMLLIVMGGIGFVVWFDIIDTIRKYLAIQFFISWVDVYTIIKAQSKAIRHIHKYRFLLSRNSYSRFLQFRASQKLYKNVNVEYDPFSLQRKIF